MSLDNGVTVIETKRGLMKKINSCLWFDKEAEEARD
jgi:hypothetical protein